MFSSLPYRNNAEYDPIAKDSRLERDLKDDLKQAIDHFYNFKNELAGLHPQVLTVIESMFNASS